MGVLAVEIDRRPGQFGQRGDRGGATVDIRARAAVGRNHPGQHVFAHTVTVGHLDPAVDAGLRGTNAHHRRVGTTADQQLDGFDEHGLARTGLAGECGDTATQNQRGPVDDPQVLDVQFGEHAAHSYRRGVTNERMFARISTTITRRGSDVTPPTPPADRDTPVRTRRSEGESDGPPTGRP